jgi:hypothetical protein
MAYAALSIAEIVTVVSLVACVRIGKDQPPPESPQAADPEPGPQKSEPQPLVRPKDPQDSRREERKELEDQIERAGCVPQPELDEFGRRAQQLEDLQRVDCEQFYDCNTVQKLSLWVEMRINECVHKHKEAARNELDLELTRMSQDAAYVVPVLSLSICRDQEALAKIKARAPVVLNKSEDYMKRDIREFRATIVEKWKSSPVACSELKILNQCVEDKATCSDEDRLLMELYWRSQRPRGL